MPRRTVQSKKYIYVFCEGESEEEYAGYLKDEFSNAVVIKPQKGLFAEAEAYFRKDRNFKNNIDITDEVWFFFDVELSDRDKWDSWMKSVRFLANMAKTKRKIKIRFLMTTGCVEYWFLLHYEKQRPLIQTTAEKDRVEQQVRTHEPSYQKGDRESIRKIANYYKTAVSNGEWVISQLNNVDNIVLLSAEDERNKQLFQCGKTFTTVHEAIFFLSTLPKLV